MTCFFERERESSVQINTEKKREMEKITWGLSFAELGYWKKDMIERWLPLKIKFKVGISVSSKYNTFVAVLPIFSGLGLENFNLRGFDKLLTDQTIKQSDNQTFTRL